MEISRVKNNSPVNSNNKKIETRKDFSQSFNFARQNKNEQELKEMLKDIKKKGSRLVITKTYGDVKIYKNMIKKYLEAVLEQMYRVKKDMSFWQTQYFITVEIIDKKLEELANMLLVQEKDNLDIASTIDEITGFVVDIYK